MTKKEKKRTAGAGLPGWIRERFRLRYLVIALAVLAVGYIVMTARPKAPPAFGVPLEDFTPQQLEVFMNVAHEVECPCPDCKGMSLFDCRVQKPTCATSVRTLKVAAELIRSGQDAESVIAALRPMEAPPPEITRPAPALPSTTAAAVEEAIEEELGETPFLGPETAKVTVLAYSDFQ